MNSRKWHADWQNMEHARRFDYRVALSNRNLIRDYEAYNDVQILANRVDGHRDLILLELGCATGEFYRYLQITHPRIHYYGVDISKPAIQRAQEKYPEGSFFVSGPDLKGVDLVKGLGIPRTPEIVYSKDVVHHQERPFEFVSELIETASESVIFRCRTRDEGKTELDPEKSCQYHYEGWMPYIVTNLTEMIDSIRGTAPHSEIVVYRNHMVLGGQHNRCLPKDCYLKTTGTAETAFGVFLTTDHPGRVKLEDRQDRNPRYSLDYMLTLGVRRALRLLRSRQ